MFPHFIRVAVRSGFVDRPVGRKKHGRNVPPIGGLIIFPVFIIMAVIYILSKGLGLAPYMSLFTALSLILVTGALDDRYTIPANVKFVVQFIAAIIIVIFGHVHIWNLGNLFGFGDVPLGFMMFPFYVFCTVLLINAVNLMDGLDGLAAGNGFVVFFWLSVCTIMVGSWDYLGLMLVLMGVITGFLFYNMRRPFTGRWRRKKAVVFLGDSGSMALGLVMAWFAINVAKVSSMEIYPITIAWVLALPIMDTCAQFVRRISQGKHPFDADNEHFHHHFVESGVSAGNSVAVIVFISFILGFLGYLGSRFGVYEPVLACLWLLLLFFHVFMSMKPYRYRNIISYFSGKS